MRDSVCLTLGRLRRAEVALCAPLDEYVAAGAAISGSEASLRVSLSRRAIRHFFRAAVEHSPDTGRTTERRVAAQGVIAHPRGRTPAVV